MILPGQITQVEHRCIQRHCDMLSQFCMIVVNPANLLAKALLRNSAAGTLDCSRLDVKGKHPALRRRLLAEKQGVVSVAGSRIKHTTRLLQCGS